MTSSFEYRKRAQDCVELAQTVSAKDKPLLLQMARAWLGLADQRAAEEADRSIAPTRAATEKAHAH